MPASLTLLHMSDLHLKHPDHDAPTDLDSDVRELFLADVVTVLSDRRVDRVLATGDLAFAGKPEEFTYANGFLARLCERVGANQRDVRVVPGNHDVDRTVINASEFPPMGRDRLRAVPLGEVDDTLKKLVQDDLDPLLKPLRAYNEFASAYLCDVAAQQWWWGDAHLRLGDVTVRIRGISTALISDANDSDEAENRKLVVGRHQLSGDSTEDDFRVLLGHHPPSWWRDARELSAYRRRWHLQLYGHEHAYEEEDARDNMVLVADALHPENGPSWCPGYSVIELVLEDTEEDGFIEIVARAESRMWHRAEARFGPRIDADGDTVKERRFKIRGSMPSESTTVEAASGETASGEAAVEPALDDPPATPEDASPADPEEQLRELIFRFRTGIPRARQLGILGELELFEEHEWSAHSGTVLITLALERAVEREQLRSLWTAAKAAGAALQGPNPYP